MSVYGLLAEFTDGEAVLEAARRLRAAGLSRVDAYTPFPLEGLTETLGGGPNRVALMGLCGGVVGAGAGYGMQWYSATLDYPINVGGRPWHSWAAFLPTTLELALLGAAIGILIGVLAWSHLPCLHHPLFNVPAFERASRDRFFLCIRADDPALNAQTATALLQELCALAVYEVPE